jgi:acetylglutamate kinase
MTRVIKIGGRAQADARLPERIASAWREDAGALCVVHGGGDEISTLQRALGLEPAFSRGRRITSERDLDVIRMALSGSANKRLVARLNAAGIAAIGVSGEDASLIAAHAAEDMSLGRAGTPARVTVHVLHHLLGGGYLPVVSPLARDADSPTGAALNVNGDDAAAAIAAALEASELLFVADVPGVLVAGVPVPVLDVDSAMQAIAHGVADGGMAAKLQAGIVALHQGVERVRIGDLDAILDPDRGTILTPSRSFV